MNVSRLLLLLFSFTVSHVFSQITVSGTVRDAKTKTPVPYCAVGLKHKSNGCLSNEEGLFQLKLVPETDTLIFQCIGYRPFYLSAKQFVADPVVYLQSQLNQLQEVTVYSSDEYLYDILDACRRNLMNFKERNSKAYYVLQSEITGQPVELLECYYNATYNNARVKELAFKNGRVGIADLNGRYFVNLNISKVFTFLDLINESSHLPGLPFHYTKKSLKKNYSLRLKEISGTDEPVYVIEFKPKIANGKYFSGEVWIDKQSSQLNKITLNIVNTRHHPFLPAFEGLSEIGDVSMQVTKTFAKQDKEMLLSHIDFNYQLHYKHLHQKSLQNDNPDTAFTVESKGVLYFYDHAQPFILPYFYYDAELSDYRKIASLSYNELFWQTNNGLLYSQKMKQDIQYFKRYGQLINYTNAYNNKEFVAGGGKWGFENNYLRWSEKKRLLIKKDVRRDSTIGTNTYNASQYNLKAQLFMDLNLNADSVQHFTASILDVYQTYYNLPEEPHTNCFVNIYFDLYELERRHLEKSIQGRKLSTAQLDALYKKTVTDIDSKTSDYLKEVMRGKNKAALRKWNDLVKQELGVDNMSLFGLN